MKTNAETLQQNKARTKKTTKLKFCYSFVEKVISRRTKYLLQRRPQRRTRASLQSRATTRTHAKASKYLKISQARSEFRLTFILYEKSGKQGWTLYLVAEWTFGLYRPLSSLWRFGSMTIFGTRNIEWLISMKYSYLGRTRKEFWASNLLYIMNLFF